MLNITNLSFSLNVFYSSVFIFFKKYLKFCTSALTSMENDQTPALQLRSQIFIEYLFFSFRRLTHRTENTERNITERIIVLFVGMS